MKASDVVVIESGATIVASDAVVIESGATIVASDAVVIESVAIRVKFYQFANLEHGISYPDHIMVASWSRSFVSFRRVEIE